MSTRVEPDATFVSADSHVLEPGNLWRDAVPARLKDRVPHVVDREGKSFLVGEGLDYFPLSMTFAAGTRGEFKNEAALWSGRPDAGHVVAARFEAMEIDGVAGEVLYPTIGLNLYKLPDAEIRAETIRIYNEWLAEFVRDGDGRFVGIGMLDVTDPARAARDLAVIKDLGHGGAMIPSVAPEDYNQTLYEPIWEAAAALGLPVSIHVGAGGEMLRAKGPGAAGINFVNFVRDIQYACECLIWAGVYDRYPGLKAGFVEGGIGWIASLLDHMDDKFEQHNAWMRPRLERPPSSYFATNCFATFERDLPGMLTRQWPGVESIMWATDYPHAESAWPESRAFAEKNFAGFPEDEVARITYANVEALYDWYPRAKIAGGAAA